VPVVGFAKQNEEVFLPDKVHPLLLPPKSQGLYLIQRIRDEAHRFAITSHRSKRLKTGLASQLEAVPGIGPVKRKALLGHFGSVEKIRKASLEELANVQGIDEELAQAIHEHL